MGLYERTDSPFWWMTLDGSGLKESTGIRRDASSSEIRKMNRASAEAIYHARMTQLARARVGLPLDSTETFDAFSRWYEAHHTDKHRSADRERVILEHLRAWFTSSRLAEIRPARWTEYESQRRKAGVSINTIGRELAVMKSILAAAVGEHLEVSPLVHVKRKSTRLPPKRTVSKADEVKILKAITDPEIRDLYQVGVGTLLRQMNLVMLQRRQHHGSRLVVMTKTGPHQVPLDGPTHLQRRAALVLKRRMPKTSDGYFFPTWQRRFSKARDSGNAFFLKVVRRAVKAAGFEWGLKNHGLVWHTMTRASGATRLIREFGIDVRTVQLLGPWRSLDQMAEYLGIDLSPAAVTPKAKRKSA